MKCSPECACTACIVNEGRATPFPEAVQDPWETVGRFQYRTVESIDYAAQEVRYHATHNEGSEA